jgi:hypothetical protein
MSLQKEILRLIEERDGPRVADALRSHALKTLISADDYEVIAHAIASACGGLRSFKQGVGSDQEAWRTLDTILVPKLRRHARPRAVPIKEILPFSENFGLLRLGEDEQLCPQAAWVSATLLANAADNIGELDRSIPRKDPLEENPPLRCYPFLVRHPNGLSAVAVTNNGPRMAPEIFRSLGARGVSTKGEGRGVGLASCAASARRRKLAVVALQWGKEVTDVRDLSKGSCHRLSPSGEYINGTRPTVIGRRRAQLYTAIRQQAQVETYNNANVAFGVVGPDRRMFRQSRPRQGAV